MLPFSCIKAVILLKDVNFFLLNVQTHLLTGVFGFLGAWKISSISYQLSSKFLSECTKLILLQLPSGQCNRSAGLQRIVKIAIGYEKIETN